MRTLLALSAVIAFYGCAATPVRPPYEEKFAEIDAALAQMPASPERNRIEMLLAEIRALALSDPDAVQLSDHIEEVATLRRLAAAVEVSQVEIGFATGFKDWDGDGEYDGIEVHFTPRDARGDAVKRPGRATIILLEHGFMGSMREVEEWTASPGLLANSWNEGLFPAYVLRLQWRGPTPEIGQASIRVNFQPLAGRPVSARRQIERRPE